jgi:uncharacterized protein DUF6959
MEKMEMEVFSLAGNEPIIRLPGKCYPDCLIGHSQLGLFHQLASSILERVRASGDQKLVGDAEALQMLLMARLKWYEQVCRENGIKLPY